MKKNRILLSSGSFPWMGLAEITSLARITGYDGIELVPTKEILREINNLDIRHLRSIKSIHQNWRLDIGFDNTYGIKFLPGAFFTILRYLFFSTINVTSKAVYSLSKKLRLPVTVHGLSDRWTECDRKEYPGGISYEIIGTIVNRKELKSWLGDEKHTITADSRDDQSLVWAKKYGHNTWKTFWKWLGIKKIKGYQLTLIGIGGLKKIMSHEKSLPEEQLLWFYKNKWTGYVTVEVNPLTLFFLFKGDMKKGLATINQFVKQTLIKGKKWSN